MNGFRFFAEYPEGVSKRRPVSDAVNVVALSTEDRGCMENGQWVLECISGVYDRANSDVATTSVSRAYLNSRCKRVSEVVARKIHPRLFERLDTKD